MVRCGKTRLILLKLERSRSNWVEFLHTDFHYYKVTCRGKLAEWACIASHDPSILLVRVWLALTPDSVPSLQSGLVQIKIRRTFLLSWSRNPPRNVARPHCKFWNSVILCRLSLREALQPTAFVVSDQSRRYWNFVCLRAIIAHRKCTTRRHSVTFWPLKVFGLFLLCFLFF